MNISLPAIKKGCNWIVTNVPDLSLLMGWKRKAANIGFLIFALYLSSVLLLEGITVWGLLTKMAIIAVVATIFYSKSIAFISLKFVEQYQERMKKFLNLKSEKI